MTTGFTPAPTRVPGPCIIFMLRTCAALLVGLCSVGLSSGYYSGDEHPEEAKVTAACELCSAQLGHALNTSWTGCVVDELLLQQNEAKKAGRSDFFPVVPHKLDPFATRDRAGAGDGVRTSELLKNLLRNYSCDHADGGSQPVRSMTWEYRPADPCAAVGDKPRAPFAYKAGFLPAGDDLVSVWSGDRWLPAAAAATQPQLTVVEAQAACLLHKRCAGFTFNSPSRDEAHLKHTVHFKTIANGASPADGWHTYKQLRNDCRPGHRPPPPSVQRFQVDVLREEPPVYVVRDFVDDAECEHMTTLTIPKMERSVVFGASASGGTSTHRQSYSVNMHPDYDDEGNVVTRVVRRKFAFAREVAE